MFSMDKSTSKAISNYNVTDIKFHLKLNPNYKIKHETKIKKRKIYIMGLREKVDINNSTNLGHWARLSFRTQLNPVSPGPFYQCLVLQHKINNKPCTKI